MSVRSFGLCHLEFHARTLYILHAQNVSPVQIIIIKIVNIKVDFVFFKVEYTTRTVKTIGSVILGLPSSVAVFLKDAQQHNSLKEMTSNKLKQLEVSEIFLASLNLVI